VYVCMCVWLASDHDINEDSPFTAESVSTNKSIRLTKSSFTNPPAIAATKIENVSPISPAAVALRCFY